MAFWPWWMKVVGRRSRSITTTRRVPTGILVSNSLSTLSIGNQPFRFSVWRPPKSDPLTFPPSVLSSTQLNLKSIISVVALRSIMQVISLEVRGKAISHFWQTQIVISRFQALGSTRLRRSLTSGFHCR